MPLPLQNWYLQSVVSYKSIVIMNPVKTSLDNVSAYFAI